MQRGFDPIRVLIVDDDPLCLALLEKQLTRRGFDVIKAESALAAFEILRRQGPPLLITELSLPGMSGLELCRLVRSSPEIAYTYTIVQSGYSERASILAGYEAGADDFISKPVDEPELSARMKAAERIIRLDAFYREHTLRLHKVNAEVAVMNGRLERLNTELDHARLRAESASASKTAFLADMSHELRSPMTAILGYAELLQADGDISKAPPSRIEAIDAILRNSLHLLDLVNDVLDLSKIEEGSTTFEDDPCDPVHLTQDVCGLLTGRAVSKGLKLQFHADENVPQVLTNPLRLRQILINLITNAIKFTEHGSVSVELHFHSKKECAPGETGVLVARVRDTGIGMSEEQVARLFHRYAQADSSIQSRFGGSGLGLTISQRLARLLGGEIEIASNPGQGSTFTLRLPAKTIVPMQSPSIQPGGQADGEPSGLRGRHVLLVEDASDNRRLFYLHLTKAGATVTLAEDGRAGSDAVSAAMRAHRPIDVILVDYQMPDMNGAEAARSIRACGYSGPIIGLTAGSVGNEKRFLLDAGCNICLTKPISRDAVLAAIHTQLHQTQALENKMSSNSDPLVSNLATDPEMVELVEMFVSEMPDRVSAIRKAVEDNDLATLTRLAHQLKGSAGGYGFPWITAAARELEASARQATDLDAVRKQVDDLAGLCERSRATANPA